MEQFQTLISESVQAGMRQLGSTTMENILLAVITGLVGMAVIRFLMKLLTQLLARTSLERVAHQLLLSIAKAVLYTLLGLSIASRLGINVTGVLTLAGTLTLAVTLSMQSLFSSVIGGMTVINAKPFHSGDYVSVDGTEGTVKSISIFYTQLVTVDNKLVCIPNSKISSSEVVNYTILGKRRMELHISATYDAATRDVIDALLTAAATEKTLSDPAPFAAVWNYGDHAIEYILRLWSTTDNYWDNYFDVNLRVKDVFDERGIGMTYPHLNVHFDDTLGQQLQKH